MVAAEFILQQNSAIKISLLHPHFLKRYIIFFVLVIFKDTTTMFDPLENFILSKDDKIHMNSQKLHLHIYKLITTMPFQVLSLGYDAPC